MEPLILITGGSGLVGRALAAHLTATGHRALCLGRRADPARGILGWEAMDAALPEAGAIVNLAGEGIADRRWTAPQRLRILESRTLTTRRIVEAMSRLASPPALVNASAVGIYGCRDGAPVDEGCPPGQGFLPEVCRAWEAEADAASSIGARVVKLRFGMVLAREGGALPRLARPLRWGLGAKLGSGEQGISWIHIGDLLHLIAEAALDPSYAGVYNAVAPDPVSNRVFTRTLGRVLHRPVLPVPGWVTGTALRLALGPMAAEMLLGGAFVRPARLEARGFAFRFPTLGQALEVLYSPGASR